MAAAIVLLVIAAAYLSRSRTKPKGYTTKPKIVGKI